MRRTKIIRSRFPTGVLVIPTAAIPATTWNTNDKSTHIILTNNDLTAHADELSDSYGVRTVAAITANQKVYLEFVYDVANNGTNPGFAFSNFILDSLGLGVAAKSFGIHAGMYFANATSPDHDSQVLSSSPTNGTVVCMAYDSGINRFWARVADGIWNNNASADPTAGLSGGGATVVGMNGSTYGLFVSGSGESVAPQVTARFAKTSWQYAEPSGFTQIAA